MNPLLHEIDPTAALSFSGHRPNRLPGQGDPTVPEMRTLTAVLQKEIIAAINRGMTAMLQGCMCGWDIICGEQVIEVKKQYPHIRLVSVAPYSVRLFSKEDCWTPEWENRAREVCRQSDISISLAEHYRKGIYFERNRVLVNHSSLLIVYHDGGSGGTKFTIDRAKEKGLTIKNLYGSAE